MANLDFKGKHGGPALALIVAPQALTVNWVDLGGEQFVQGATRASIWIELDINDSANARVRMLAKWEEDGANEYVLPILTVAAAVVQVEDEFIEFNVDADQSMKLAWELDGTFPWVQFQVQAGVVGAAAGQIDSAYITTGVF